MPIEYEQDQRLTIPKDHLRFIREPLEPGVEFAATDLGNIAENTGDELRYARYKMRIDSVGEDTCECVVLQRLPLGGAG